jgi:hypothetical protein
MVANQLIKAIPAKLSSEAIARLISHMGERPVRMMCQAIARLMRKLPIIHGLK